MQQEVKELIKERYTSLPKEMQDALVSDTLYQNILKVGQKHGLLIDKLGQFEDEVLMLMLGASDGEIFPTTLKENLGVPQEKAEALAADVATEIFTPIREVMKASGQAKSSVPAPAKAGAGISQGDPRVQTPFTASVSSAVSPLKKTEAPPVPTKPPSGIRQVQIDRSTLTKPQIAEVRPQAPEAPAKSPVPPPSQSPSPDLSLTEIPPSGISAAKSPQTPVPSSPAPRPLENIFARPQVRKEEIIDVGLSSPTPKKDYKGTDPYREPVE